MRADLDPRDTAEVLRRVVVPVAESLITADELEDVLAEVRAEEAFGGVDMLSLGVKARGEWLIVPQVWFVDDGPMDAEWLAGDFFDLLQDEVAESRFAWGQLRTGDYEIPSAQRS